MITIRQLLEFDDLRLELVAGAAGGDRRVAWAQASDLDDPSPWLEGGELLITRAAALPRTSKAQAAFVRRVADRAVAGLVVAGDGAEAADLTPGMRQAADDAALPLLTMGSTSFSALSQVIASGSQDHQYHRLSTTVRVYGSLGELARTGPDRDAVLQRIGAIIGYELTVATPYGAPLFDGMHPHVDVPVEDLLAALERRESETPVRVLLDGTPPRDVCLVPIVARRHALGVLIATPTAQSTRNDMMLRHAATVVSLLAAEVLAERAQKRRDDGERLTRLLAAAEGGDAVLLGDVFRAGAADRICYVAIALPPDGTGWDEVHHRLHERGMAHVLSERGDRGRIVVRLGTLEVRDLATILAESLPGSIFGLSSVLPGDVLLRQARREARWALQRALTDGTSPQVFESAMPDWLALDHSGLEIMVDRILGPLLAHDEETGSELVKTLQILLEEGRSWKVASNRLYVHRQTLLQRGKRIEQLTGRRLSSTADVCDFWLALRAREVLERSDAAGRDPAAPSPR